MPNCFALCRKCEPSVRISLEVVDTEMRQHFLAETEGWNAKMLLAFKQDPTKFSWFMDWYNSIGWMLAVKGESLEQLKTTMKGWGPHPEYNEILIQIVCWMDKYFVVDAWVRIGR